MPFFIYDAQMVKENLGNVIARMRFINMEHFTCSEIDVGGFHLTGLVHISEVSWDLVHDVRDILAEGDEVKAKVVNIDR